VVTNQQHTGEQRHANGCRQLHKQKPNLLGCHLYLGVLWNHTGLPVFNEQSLKFVSASSDAVNLSLFSMENLCKNLQNA
jgi:hypothetical protein